MYEWNVHNAANGDLNITEMGSVIIHFLSVIFHYQPIMGDGDSYNFARVSKFEVRLVRVVTKYYI